MTDNADRDGFDPFREEHPAHEVKSLGELVPKDLLKTWGPGDPAKPPPKQVKCGQCHKDYMSKAAWFGGKWKFANICVDCADGNTLPPGFQAECNRAPIRQISCPRCGVSRNVEAVLRDNLLQYDFTCARDHCGYSTTMLRRLRRNCVNCGEAFLVNENWPRRVCRACHQNIASSADPYH